MSENLRIKLISISLAYEILYFLGVGHRDTDGAC